MRRCDAIDDDLAPFISQVPILAEASESNVRLGFRQISQLDEIGNPRRLGRRGQKRVWLDLFHPLFSFGLA